MSNQLSNLSYYEQFRCTKAARDVIYETSLWFLLQNRSNLLEIGVSRGLDLGSRRGDGWSSMHFGQYVSRFGGHLDLVDISTDSLKNCEKLVSSIVPRPDCSLYHGDGLTFLKETKNFYNMILIDGSDDPQEMLDCFEIAKTKSDFILCDDFHAKGSKLRFKYPRHILFKIEGIEHEMALYNSHDNFAFRLINMPYLEW